MKKSFLCLILCLNFLCLYADIRTYPAPPGSELNTAFTVKVRQNEGPWQQIDIYLARIANNTNGGIKQERTSFGYFDFSGELEVSVTVKEPIVSGVNLRPRSYGITPVVNGNTIGFKLRSPRNISLEVNGNIFNNLHLFANPLNRLSRAVADSNLIYFGPGIHRVGVLKVLSGKTIYIAGGAIVQGQLLMDRVHNVKILGRGIITQLPLPGDSVTRSKAGKGLSKMRGDEITINYSANIEVNGVIVLPHKYSVFIGQSDSVKISNLKSFSSEGNADGIDVFCSRKVYIDSVFMRNSDDCIAVYGHRWSFFGNTHKVIVTNSTLWADIAHPVLIGTHGDSVHPDTLSDISFKNIDILDQHENQIDYQGCLALNAGDKNLIKNVSFTDVNIENIRKGQLLNLRVMYNKKYNTSPGRGIENVLFKNLSYTGANPNLSVISGYDEARTIKNVIFENLRINGQLIYDDMTEKPSFYKTGDMANIMIGEHTDGIKFIVSQ